MSLIGCNLWGSRHCIFGRSKKKDGTRPPVMYQWATAINKGIILSLHLRQYAPDALAFDEYPPKPQRRIR